MLTSHQRVTAMGCSAPVYVSANLPVFILLGWDFGKTPLAGVTATVLTFCYNCGAWTHWCHCYSNPPLPVLAPGKPAKASGSFGSRARWKGWLIKTFYLLVLQTPGARNPASERKPPFLVLLYPKCLNNNNNKWHVIVICHRSTAMTCSHARGSRPHWRL